MLRNKYILYIGILFTFSSCEFSQPKTEDQYIADMKTLLKEKLSAEYEIGNTQRATHVKSHGLVKAKFDVVDSLPDELRVGIFKTPKTFNAWMRFSNARGMAQSDKIKDFRGLSIKLISTSDNKIITHDFVLQSYPTMALGTVKDFRDGMYYDLKKSRLYAAVAFVFSGRLGVLLDFNSGRQLHSSPLDIDYWSATPYRFGKKIVKYRLKSTSDYKSEAPKDLSDNYLKENMMNHLQNDAATFDFEIQFYINEKLTPIEEARTEWKESDSPFIKIAEITIPKQSFDSQKRRTLQMQLSFDPSNVPGDHQPVGGLNRARKAIYNVLASFRSNRDNIELITPSFEEID